MKSIKHKITRFFTALAVLCFPALALAGNAIYSYDAYDRLTRTLYDNGPVIDYTYDAVGNMASRTVIDTVAYLSTAGTGQGTVNDASTPAPESCGTDCYIYAAGQTVTLTASPGAGYLLVSWSEAACGNSLTCSFTINGLKHVTANFYPTNYQMYNQSAGTNGTVEASPSFFSGFTTVAYGSNMTFNVTPDDGYVTSSVLIDGASAAIADSYTFSTVNASHSIDADFTEDPVTVSPTSADFGTLECGSTSTATTFTLENTGSTARTVESVAFSGSAETEYSISSDNCTNSTLSPNATCTVDVTFSPALKWSGRTANLVFGFTDEGTTTVRAYLVGQGGETCEGDMAVLLAVLNSILLRPGEITVTAGEGGSVNKLSETTFEIVPDAGYGIMDVSVDGVSQGAISIYTFTDISNDHTLSATFIETTQGTNGNINWVSEGTFEIVPDAGYEILGVSADGVSVGIVSTYTFTDLTVPHSLSATFISITTDENGVIDIVDSYTVEITPDDGFVVEDVLVDGVSVGPVTSYTFTDTSVDHTIEASFTVDPGWLIPLLKSIIGG